MSRCCGKEATTETVRDKEINKEIADDKKRLGDEIRLLLLGAGESGKSTIAKQMKIIHMGGYTTDERKEFITAVHQNMYESIQTLIRASEDLDIPIKSEKNQQFAEHFDEDFTQKALSNNQSVEIASLWDDEGIQKVYERRHKFQLIDSCKYYLDDCERICSDDYIPTEQDILRTRIQTTGIIETSFTVENKKFTVVDVGGQRSERKKWMHCFENVTGVLFCVGISAFDQTLYEDNSTNRIREALKLFHEVCISKWFTQTAMILFLNKEDIFKEKLAQNKNINIAFPDYEGECEFEPSIAFIEAKFTNVNDPVTGRKREVYTHVTCATNTQNVKVVFEAVKDSILTQALQASGII